jgi:hypothetical protein
MPMVHVLMGKYRVALVVRPAAGGMAQQMVDSDHLDEPIVGNVLRQNAIRAEYVIREIQMALFDQRKDGNSCDGLTGAGDAKEVGGRDRSSHELVCEAKPLRATQSGTASRCGNARRCGTALPGFRHSPRRRA